MIRQIGLSLCLLVLCFSGACAQRIPPTVTTPQGRAAVTADSVVLRLGELQGAAIQANQQGGLSDRTSVLVVQFTVGALKTIKDVPSGWQATVTTGYRTLKSALSPADLQRLQVPLLAVDLLLLDGPTR